MYTYLPVGAAVVAFFQLRRSSTEGFPRHHIVKSFILIGAIGPIVYFLFPVVGPAYAFGNEVVGAGWMNVWPHVVPTSLEPVSAYFSQAAPRNCMPSLHTAWATAILLHSLRGPRLLKLFGVEAVDTIEEEHGPAELQRLMSTSQEAGSLPDEDARLLAGAGLDAELAQDDAGALRHAVPRIVAAARDLGPEVRLDRDDDGALAWSNSLSGSALRDYRFNYALTQQHSSAVGSEGTGHVSYQGDGGRLDAGYGQGRGYRKVDMAVAGSVVGFHSRDDRAAQGIVLGQSLGDTIAVVDAPGYADASVDGQLSTRTDARGRAIISYLTPYRVNRVGLDSLTAGEDLDYGSLLREVAPVSGSVLYVPIHPQKMPGLDSR